MKRNNELLRTILLESEASDEVYIEAQVYSGLTEDELNRIYHVRLLADVGYVVPHGNQGLYRITNQGYDFLAAVHDEGIWKKTKDGAAAVGGVTLGLLKDIAISYVKAEITQKLGISV